MPFTPCSYVVPAASLFWCSVCQVYFCLFERTTWTCIQFHITDNSKAVILFLPRRLVWALLSYQSSLQSSTSIILTQCKAVVCTETCLRSSQQIKTRTKLKIKSSSDTVPLKVTAKHCPQKPWAAIKYAINEGYRYGREGCDKNEDTIHFYILWSTGMKNHFRMSRLYIWFRKTCK